jgi:hypothetical protein
LDYGGRDKYYHVLSFQLSNGINQYCGNGFIIHEVTEFVRKMTQLRSIAAEDPLTKAKKQEVSNYNANALLSRAAAAGKGLGAHVRHRLF